MVEKSGLDFVYTEISSATMQMVSNYERTNERFGRMSWATYSIDSNVALLKKYKYILPTEQYVRFDQDTEKLLFRHYTEEELKVSWWQGLRIKLAKRLLP